MTTSLVIPVVYWMLLNDCRYEEFISGFDEDNIK